jgi:hypothetical protein
MADFDGFLVSLPSPSFSDAETHAPIVDGAFQTSKPFASSDAAFFVPDVGGGVTYRMRATDTTLVQVVYWNATSIDDTGSQYGGPGPLINIVVQNVTCA